MNIQASDNMARNSHGAQPPVGQLEPGSAAYPAGVEDLLGRKAPTLRFLGNPALLMSVGVGFCGSRHASTKGIATAKDSAAQLAEWGFTIVSGNAAGVDAEAHRTALEVGGSTILVLPEGISHFRIKKDLQNAWDWDRVLVISQYPDSSPWAAFRAMERNALIVALSRATIVIEAGETGGTLNAGMTTIKHKKPLFVAIYEDMSNSAKGNSILIDLGGIPLSRSRTTGRAAVAKIRDTLDSNETGTTKNEIQGTLF